MSKIHAQAHHLLPKFLKFPKYSAKQKITKKTVKSVVDEILEKNLRPLAGVSFPAGSSVVPLAYLSDLVDVLAEIIRVAAGEFVGDLDLDGDALDEYLVASVPFLDVCNSVSAEIGRVRRALLPLRLAVRLLSGENGGLPDLDHLRRARKAVEEFESCPIGEIRLDAGNLIKRLSPAAEPLPATKNSSARRATYTLESMSRLVSITLVSVLAGGREDFGVSGLRVAGDRPWSSSFETVQLNVSSRLVKEYFGEVAAVESTAKKLKESISDEIAGKSSSEIVGAVRESEMLVAELMDRLNRLSDSINSVFHAGINIRRNALDRLRNM